jgi:amino acid transporter
MATTEKTPVGKLGGKRRLSLIDTVAQSVGFMGPVFSIAFLVPLLVGLNASGKGAGAAAPLSVLIAAIGVLGLGWIISEYSRRIHAAGSLYDYVTDGLGQRIGTAAGYLYYLGVLALSAGILVMTAGTIHDTIQGEFNRAPFPQLVWEIILLVLVLAILYLGVALSTRAQLTLAMISIAVVSVFFVYVIIKVGSHNSLTTALKPSSSKQGFGGVLFGVLYGVLLFTGFEAAANLAEETENPKRTIPKAILISVLAISGFYLVGSYAQVAGFHFNLKLLTQNASAPLFALAGPKSGGGYASVWIRRLTELVVIFDMIAVLIGTAVSVSRGFFAMGRDKRLPIGLAKVSGRGTPINSIVTVGVVFIITMIVTLSTKLFALPQTPHYVAIFSWLSTFGGFALVVIYLLVAIGALRGLRDHERLWAVYLAVVVGGLVAIGAIYGSIYKVTRPTIYAPYACLGVLVVGLVVAYVLPRVENREIVDFTELTESEQGRVKL